MFGYNYGRCQPSPGRLRLVKNFPPALCASTSLVETTSFFFFYCLKRLPEVFGFFLHRVCLVAQPPLQTQRRRLLAAASTFASEVIPARALIKALLKERVTRVQVSLKKHVFSSRPLCVQAKPTATTNTYHRKSAVSMFFCFFLHFLQLKYFFLFFKVIFSFIL